VGDPAELRDGPLSVTLNYEHLSAHNSPSTRKQHYVAGARTIFGVASHAFEHVKTGTPPNGRPPAASVGKKPDSWLSAATFRSPRMTVCAPVRRLHRPHRAKDSCRSGASAAGTSLSKRTNFYADFA